MFKKNHVGFLKIKIIIQIIFFHHHHAWLFFTYVVVVATSPASHTAKTKNIYITKFAKICKKKMLIKLKKKESKKSIPAVDALPTSKQTKKVTLVGSK